MKVQQNILVEQKHIKQVIFKCIPKKFADFCYSFQESKEGVEVCIRGNSAMFNFFRCFLNMQISQTLKTQRQLSSTGQKSNNTFRWLIFIHFSGFFIFQCCPILIVIFAYTFIGDPSNIPNCCVILITAFGFYDVLFTAILLINRDCSFVESSRPRNRPSSGQQQLSFGDSANPLFDKESIFEQGKQIGTYGETRDFLAFLRRIQYDHRQCPDINGKAVDIDVSIVVSNIRAVSEVTMDYALELFYRETWTDPRLRYNKALFKNKTELALHESYTNFLWHPDTFMPNAIASKNPMKHSISHRSLLRLQETGRVLYSRRISIVAECPMDLTLFPFDSQNCKLGIESYGYTADQVKYKWSKGAISSLTLQKIRLPDFQIKQAYVTSQMESYATGDYSRLYVCFVFTRSSGFCFLQLIIPSTAVVITSWVSLWMESESEFQDMVSIILAITFLIFSYNEMMPRVSYIKAMDVYLGVCFMIVFLSLIKLSFFKYLRQKLKHSRDKQMVQGFLPVLRIESALDERNGSIVGNGISSPTGSALTADVDNNLCRRGSFQYTAVPIPNEGEEPAAQLFTSAAKNKTFSKFIPKWEFTTKTVQRLHWISQMIFFFFFVSFVLFFFIFYPNLHFVPIDPACLKEDAEWSAEIP